MSVLNGDLSDIQCDLQFYLKFVCLESNSSIINEVIEKIIERSNENKEFKFSYNK